MTIKTCDKCRFYTMIDSGYGCCRRYPPVSLKVLKRMRLFAWKEIMYDALYPEVAWCKEICGEFLPKGEGKWNGMIK